MALKLSYTWPINKVLKSNIGKNNVNKKFVCETIFCLYLYVSVDSNWYHVLNAVNKISSFCWGILSMEWSYLGFRWIVLYMCKHVYTILQRGLLPFSDIYIVDQYILCCLKCKVISYSIPIYQFYVLTFRNDVSHVRIMIHVENNQSW